MGVVVVVDVDIAALEGKCWSIGSETHAAQARRPGSYMPVVVPSRRRLCARLGGVGCALIRRGAVARCLAASNRQAERPLGLP